MKFLRFYVKFAIKKSNLKLFFDFFLLHIDKFGNIVYDSTRYFS